MQAIQNKLKSVPYYRWWIAAILCRFLAALTHSHWFHPDEWCQTFEPANLIAHGFAVHSQELGLHLRNLTWASILAGILKTTQWISPNAIHLRIFSVNFLIGLMDLGILWGWIQMISYDKKLSRLPQSVKNWGLFLLLFPWFTVYESVNPRVEHLSEIGLFLALGFYIRRFWILLGIACVGIFAVRYPSVLLSAGLGLALLIECYRKSDFRPLIKTFFGVGIGLVVFGLADWAVYTRPWESFWMYLQYNLLTGSASLAFGKQGISAYQEMFLWNWATYPVFIPLGVFLAFCGVYSFQKELRQLSPWSICLGIYLIGHFLVPHKEGRFMLPIETLTRWAAWLGCVYLYPKFKFKYGKAALAVFAGINLIFYLHALRADLWKEQGTYQDLGGLLAKRNSVCGVITVVGLNSMLMPFQTAADFPQPATGMMIPESVGAPFAVSKKYEIRWMEHPPQCKKDDSVLLHLHKLDPEWAAQGCQLLDTGILKFLPSSLKEIVIQKKWISGPWYECRADVLPHLANERPFYLFSKTFGKLESLPRVGINPKELQELGTRTAPPPQHTLLPSI